MITERKPASARIPVYNPHGQMITLSLIEFDLPTPLKARVGLACCCQEGSLNADIAEKFIERALKAHAKGNQKQAEICLRSALKELSADQKGRRANVLGLLASALMTRQRGTQALPFAKEALQLKEELGLINDVEMANLLACTAKIHAELGPASEAEEYYSRAIDLQRKLNLPILAETLSVLAVLLSKNGRENEAIPLLEEARRLACNPRSKQLIEVFSEEIHRNTGGESARNLAIQTRLSEEVDKLVKQPTQPYPASTPTKEWGRDEVTTFFQVSHNNCIGFACDSTNQMLERGKLLNARFAVSREEINRKVLTPLVASKKAPHIEFKDIVLEAEDWLEVFFLLQAQGGILSAMRSCLSGQIPETFKLLRGCLEDASYALAVSKNSKLKRVWAERHDGEDHLKKCTRAFSGTEMERLMTKTNPFLAQRAGALYDEAIDKGGHPNLKVYQKNAFQFNSNGVLNLQVAHLNPGEVSATFDTLLDVGNCILDIFREIYPECIA